MDSLTILKNEQDETIDHISIHSHSVIANLSNEVLLVLSRELTERLGSLHVLDDFFVNPSMTTSKREDSSRAFGFFDAIQDALAQRLLSCQAGKILNALSDRRKYAYFSYLLQEMPATFPGDPDMGRYVVEFVHKFVKKTEKIMDENPSFVISIDLSVNSPMYRMLHAIMETWRQNNWENEWPNAPVSAQECIDAIEQLNARARDVSPQIDNAPTTAMIPCFGALTQTTPLVPEAQRQPLTFPLKSSARIGVCAEYAARFLEVPEDLREKTLKRILEKNPDAAWAWQPWRSALLVRKLADSSMSSTALPFSTLQIGPRAGWANYTKLIDRAGLDQNLESPSDRERPTYDHLPKSLANKFLQEDLDERKQRAALPDYPIDDLLTTLFDVPFEDCASVPDNDKSDPSLKNIVGDNVPKTLNSLYFLRFHLAATRLFANSSNNMCRNPKTGWRIDPYPHFGPISNDLLQQCAKQEAEAIKVDQAWCEQYVIQVAENPELLFSSSPVYKCPESVSLCIGMLSSPVMTRLPDTENHCADDVFWKRRRRLYMVPNTSDTTSESRKISGFRWVSDSNSPWHSYLDDTINSSKEAQHIEYFVQLLYHCRSNVLDDCCHRLSESLTPEFVRKHKTHALQLRFLIMLQQQMHFFTRLQKIDYEWWINPFEAPVWDDAHVERIRFSSTRETLEAELACIVWNSTWEHDDLAAITSEDLPAVTSDLLSYLSSWVPTHIANMVTYQLVDHRQ